LIDPEHMLSVRRQCELLTLHRSGLYYRPVETPEEDERLMKKLDWLWTANPAYGSRMLASVLRLEHKEIVNRKRVQRLMRVMGIESLAPKPKPKTSEGDEHAWRYPYLLKDLVIEVPNHVWTSDITYIPFEQGWGYLVAILDWASRKVLSWRLSNTLDSNFCVEALEESLKKFEPPQIVNTDQGSQYTSKAWVERVKKAGAKVSMTGARRCWDNIMVERLWRTVKYEEVYLKAYANLVEARVALKAYFAKYNRRRPHSALQDRTPEEVYRRAA
jgi:putative transposase